MYWVQWAVNWIQEYRINFGLLWQSAEGINQPVYNIEIRVWSIEANELTCMTRCAVPSWTISLVKLWARRQSTSPRVSMNPSPTNWDWWSRLPLVTCHSPALPRLASRQALSQARSRGFTVLVWGGGGNKNKYLSHWKFKYLWKT